MYKYVIILRVKFLLLKRGKNGKENSSRRKRIFKES